MAKIKTKLKIDAFRAIQSMPPSIPALRISQINEGSPTRKPDEIPKEPLIPPPSDIFITKSGYQIISSISSQGVKSKDNGKRIATSSDNLVKPFKKSEDWSKEQTEQA